ncbi:uncharacterized protein LOC132312203 isoform X2 [Cornus florida]|uniref:uncharacterized protein LOC132312203 isoform X2 n=1 Tax=Cornus florida TaxID=4283 RepID=UPI00289ADA4B|nr:uncharacterized protein LOC132312203 isoform X2 [Cornus florida]
MDSMVEFESSKARFEGLAAVGEKRVVENGNDGESDVPLPKKARVGGGLVGDMKKVAEIVLVLAAMGNMRAGRSPTAAEKEMMEEARGKLVEVCRMFAPKDVFPREEFGGIIEDLGLNKLKEQRLAFLPPKMSIAEKCSIAMQKRLQMKSSVAAESRGKSHTVRMSSSEKQSHASNTSGSLHPASPLGHVPAANSTSLTYQLPASQVKSSVASGGLPSTHIGRDSSSSSSSTLPRVDREHFRLDGKSNGSYTSPVQANTSGDYHTQVKVAANASVKVQGTADSSLTLVAPQVKTSKSHITQNASGNLPTIHQHLQGMNFVQAPLPYNSHNEIGKIVHNLLLSQILKQPTWTPPSRDYMNKAVTCQMCKLTINEVESVLVCDACEKGFHLKCLQSHNQKGIPKGEWHCQNCLTLSSGKPLPPKYGRVTRNISAPKVSSNTPAVQSFPDNKMGTLGEKIYQQDKTANGNSGLQSAPSGNVRNNHKHSTTGSNMPNAREMQGNDISSSREKIDDKPCSGTCRNDVIKTSEAAFVSPAGSSHERSIEGKLVSEANIQPPLTSPDTVTNTLDHSPASHNLRDNYQAGGPDGAEISSDQCQENNIMVKDLERSYSRETLHCTSNREIKQDEHGVGQVNSIETSGSSNGAREPRSSDDLHVVEWVGDVLQVMDGKTYYQSCCIDGTVYKVHDHALFRSNNDKLLPSKIQAMWEDGTTRSKWVIVNQCYFPGDLPEVVGCPCAPESNEVYESNHPCTIMADLIQGQCEVLPLRKFVKENERRTRFRTGPNDGLRPLFLCKWFYDESKGLFRDTSS